MKRSVIGIAALAAGLIFGIQTASAENRVALVIGQSAYRSVPALPNPANDAKMMRDLLTSAGFEVTAVPDASQTDMRQAIADFIDKLNSKGADTVALVYYAGHGLQVDGENFLLPVDVSVLHETDVPLQGVRLNDLLNSLAMIPSKTRIVMLDACRDNPFPELEKSIGHGLALVETKAGAAGTFISFSTSPGAVAEDGTGADSPYTTALLVSAREPGLTIEEALKRVRVSVNHATDGRQTPWESSSLTTDFYFFPGSAAGHAGQTTGARTAQGWQRELKTLDPKAAYERVIAEDTVEGYQAFLVLFADSPIGTRVRDLLARRQEMIAWAAAVAINTPDAYAAFLATYPGSDLAATARKLQERARNRPQIAALGQAAIPIALPSTGAGGNSNAATLAATAPTCPCAPTPAPLTIPPLKRTDVVPSPADATPSLPKHVDIPVLPPKRVDISPPPLLPVTPPTPKRVDITPPVITHVDPPKVIVDHQPPPVIIQHPPPPVIVQHQSPVFQHQPPATARPSGGMNSDSLGAALMIGGLIAGGLAFGHHGGGGNMGGGMMHPPGRY
ncbi:MAG: caspase family protein [Xanthobacteraceae bacterium]|nr:caspase family protein [Xanthobacteraceae bacterium]